MTKKQKTKLLKTELNYVLDNKDIVDAEIDVASEDEVIVWTYEVHNEEGSIRCYYVDWYEDEENWVEDCISEMEGPAALTCPIRFFEYEVAEDERFDAWRYEVKKYHEQIGGPAQDNTTALKLAESLKKKWESQ